MPAPVHVVGITVKELVPKVNGLSRVYRGDGKASIIQIPFFTGPSNRLPEVLWKKLRG